MTVLQWDRVGERFYQIGLDRGVLYLRDGTAVAWNGLISVSDDSAVEVKPYYLDGVKYLETVVPGDYAGKLKAFTYPEEFDQVNGILDPAEGLSLYNQQPKSFNLSYRTKVGNDLNGDHSYKIHLLYNLTAEPESYSYETVGKESKATEFEWSLTGIPQRSANFRPTAHISIDSEDTPPGVLEILENLLYGTLNTQPNFPTIEEVTAMFGYLGALIIIDNGDGTWVAVDESNTYITMLDDTTFQIANADARFLDSTTYTVSTTNP
jgi:hypothetical protein